MKPTSTLRLVLILFLFPVVALAHNGNIRGTVTSEATGAPLTSAIITLDGGYKTTVTDALGRFSFIGLQERGYTLIVQSIGYATDTLMVQVREEAPLDLAIALRPGGLQLSEVSVVAGVRGAVNRVSEVDFQLRPVRTTQDLLRLVPGLFIAQHAGGGKAEQIFLRGFDIDHGTDIALTVDGMPVNMVSHAHGQGYSDLHWVIPETVENFRFGKGPYYADQGDFATAGFVAFRTKDAVEHSMLKLEGGAFNTLRGVGILKLPFSQKSKQSGYLSGEYFTTDGPVENPQNFRRYNLFGKYNAFLNPNNYLTLSGSYFTSSWDASGQIPQRAVDAGIISRFGAIDPSEGGQTGRVNANIQLTSQLGSGATWKNQLFHSKYDFNLYSNFTYFLEDSVNGDGIVQHEKRDIFGYNSTISKETHLGAKDLTLRGGVGLRYDLIDDLYLGKQRARQFSGDYLALGAVKQLNTFAWASGSLELAPKLTATAALRYDNIAYRYQDALAGETDYAPASAGRVSPKLNFTYAASRAVQLYLNSGVGFHSNDARVAVPQQGVEILPAAYGADLGANVKAGRRFLIQGALWALHLEQEFVYVGDAGIVEPGGHTLRYGADLSLRYQALDWLFADFDFNYAHGRSVDDPAGENRIPLAPTFTSIGGLTAQFKNGFKGSLRYRYIADRPANEDNSVRALGYFVNDLSLGYTRGRFDFGVVVENLFDVDWNEAQFDTESRLRGEAAPVSELHFTPGTSFYPRGFVNLRF